MLVLNRRIAIYSFMHSKLVYAQPITAKTPTLHGSRAIGLGAITRRLWAYWALWAYARAPNAFRLQIGGTSAKRLLRISECHVPLFACFRRFNFFCYFVRWFSFRV